ncbi:thiopeptide-type bacteriocin biosynthesis protein [Actinoplanes sp. HUAS TT8]|uniref:thiopeptide-type bacteriocin biosynthesis protein n=1 Tax=Actinoplanes sp. HUAS TT8 TaxID=3447453 RepID=UPI003F524F25
MRTPPSSTRSADRGWISVHVFHAPDEDPLLIGCVAPLVRRLREQRLIDRAFFVRYWVEGPHVRLRLRPAARIPAAEVEEPMHAALTAFLDRHPAPAAADRPAAELLRRTFEAEYGPAAWHDTYGRSGVMPMSPPNTYRPVPYEPEYDRYGGPAGIELAEWHFDTSTEVVLHLLSARRPDRRARLGLSAQLGLALCLAMLGDAGRTAVFLGRYRDFWEEFSGAGPALRAAYRDDQAATLRPVVERVLAASREAAPVSAWVRHCRLLRERAVTIGDAAMLTHSYLHMTNNRLGVTVAEEAYLAHLMLDALS